MATKPNPVDGDPDAQRIRAKYVRREALSDQQLEDGANPRENTKIRNGDRKAVRAMNRVLERLGSSNTSLAAEMGCDEVIVRKIRSVDRRRPFKVGHLFAIDKRTALAIWDEVKADLLRAEPANDHDDDREDAA